MSIITEDMISDKIIRKDLLPLSFLKKSAYTGSKRNLNYKLEMTEIELPKATEEELKLPSATKAKSEAKLQPQQETGGSLPPAKNTSNENAKKTDTDGEPETRTVLRAYWWVGKFAFDTTPKEDKTYRDFEFSNSGIDEAISYLNEQLSLKDAKITNIIPEGV